MAQRLSPRRRHLVLLPLLLLRVLRSRKIRRPHIQVFELMGRRRLFLEAVA